MPPKKAHEDKHAQQDRGHAPEGDEGAKHGRLAVGLDQQHSKYALLAIMPGIDNPVGNIYLEITKQPELRHHSALRQQIANNNG